MSSDLFKELIGRIDARFSTEAKDMSLGDWVCANTNLRGRPFSFDRYPFQKQIVDDMHPNMDVVKPSQVGLTEIQIRKSLGFITRNRGVSLIFTLPNDDMFERMSSTRILPLVREEKVFNLDGQTDNKPVRSKGLIQVGSSFMYVTGNKESDATSIPADVVMNDEVDLSNQQMLSLFNSRLQNSDWKINQRFSTPTFVNFGIDAGYEASDQHVYLCQCDACNHWNEPLFTHDFVRIPGLPDIALTEIDLSMIDNGQIDLNQAYIMCEKCHAELDLGRHEKREWVAKYASRAHHRGYRISPFSTDRLSIEYIVSQMFKYQQRDYIKGWYNTVLGQAYTADNARLNDAEIMKCFTPEAQVPQVDNLSPCWLGIDIGQTCHLVLTEGYRTVLFKALPVEQLPEEIEMLMSTYHIIGGAVDRFPYTPTANMVFEMTNGKVVPVEYRGQKDVNLVRDPVTQELTHAQVNRTMVIDMVARWVRSGTISFRGYGTQQSLITTHLKDMVRDEQPEKPATWVKLSGNDHYFHALAFVAAAMKVQELEHGLYGDNRSNVTVVGADLHGDDLRSYGKRRLQDLGVRNYY